MTDTLIRPEYRKTSVRHAPFEGVQFSSYRTGINRYARISEDGKIKTSRSGNRSVMYTAEVLGLGYILGRSGRPMRSRTQEAAAHAAIRTAKINGII